MIVGSIPDGQQEREKDKTLPADVETKTARSITLFRYSQALDRNGLLTLIQVERQVGRTAARHHIK